MNHVTPNRRNKERNACGFNKQQKRTQNFLGFKQFSQIGPNWFCFRRSIDSRARKWKENKTSERSRAAARSVRGVLTHFIVEHKKKSLSILPDVFLRCLGGCFDLHQEWVFKVFSENMMPEQGNLPERVKPALCAFRSNYLSFFIPTPQQWTHIKPWTPPPPVWAKGLYICLIYFNVNNCFWT